MILSAEVGIGLTVNPRFLARIPDPLHSFRLPPFLREPLTFGAPAIFHSSIDYTARSIHVSMANHARIATTVVVLDCVGLRPNVGCSQNVHWIV